MARMTFHPPPNDVVFAAQAVEFAPQVFVFDRLFGGGFPAVFLPAVYPAFHAVFNVLRVGVDFDAAAAVQGFQAFDDGGQLHAVVGGLGFAAEEFFLVPAVAQQCAPAACAGIAFACAVGVEVYGFVGGFLHDVFRAFRRPFVYSATGSTV